MLSDFLDSHNEKWFEKMHLSSRAPTTRSVSNFPKEIQDRHKTLMPAYIKAKGEGKKTELVKDKLYINGKLFTGVTTHGGGGGTREWKTED